MQPDSAPRTHEVLYCRGSQPSLVAEAARSAYGHSVIRWNSDDVVPPKTREVCLSVLATVAASCGIDESLLSVAVQTQATDGSHGSSQVYGGLVLLLSTDDDAVVANARAVASAFAAALGTRMERSGDVKASPAASSGLDSRCAKPLAVDDLVSASFLGAPIPVPLDLVVPGHASCRVQGRFKRGSGRGFTTRRLIVSGYLRWVKVGGKINRVFVNATDLETNKPFGSRPILFDNKFRESLAQALSNSSASLRLMLVEQMLDDGRSRPRVKYVLEGVELAQPTNLNQHAFARRDPVRLTADARSMY